MLHDHPHQSSSSSSYRRLPEWPWPADAVRLAIDSNLTIILRGALLLILVSREVWKDQIRLARFDLTEMECRLLNLEGVNIKIKRACESIQNLESDIGAFRED